MRGLELGKQFSLLKHPSSNGQRLWTVLEQRLTMRDIGQSTQSNHERAQRWEVTSEVDLMPIERYFYPPYTPKPKAGLHTAVVVGSEHAPSIHTDWYGRIKVQLHWDRYDTSDENSSCWARVVQPWAGNQMGALFVLRLNQEVMISFVNQDPDLPICIGHVYNRDNYAEKHRPPETLHYLFF